MSNEYLDKLRSIGVMRRAGSTNVKTRRDERCTVTETEHWDGSQDATVTPDPVRFGARVHSQGSKKGQVAEITKKGN